MTLIVANQKPAVIDALHTISCAGDYDPIPALTATVVTPLVQPLNPAHPASITLNAQSLTEDEISDILLACLREHSNARAESTIKDLLSQTLVHFDQQSALPVGELFANQAGHQNKMPSPSPRVIYSAHSDVIPAAKGLLAGTSDESEFFASLAYAYHPDTLGFWFQSSTAFDDFKTWLINQTHTMSATNIMPPDTIKLLGDFANLTLNGLTESLRLRKDDVDGNDEYSFARLIINQLMNYISVRRSAAAAAGNATEAGILPFTLGELFCPKTIVLVNAEAHARSTPQKVTGEWALINQSLNSPIKVVSTNTLARLTSLPRAAARAAAMSARTSPGQPGTRSAQVKFRKMPPTRLDLFKDITRVLKRMGKVNRSQNIYRTVKSTFARANRRDPDDYNKPGRNISTRYMPDLHIFIDTSGSISEANYQESVLMLIKLAKKMNVNLYFSSFSHILSQETLLKTSNKSVQQIWHEFRRIPKVSGGTEFKQVWDFINMSKTRKRRLSLMITDFEWYPPSKRVDHPKNLYYAPCSAMDWDDIVESAGTYADQMKHIDPTIRQKLLGMII